MSSGDIISGKYFYVINLIGNTVVNIVEACMNEFYFYLSNAPPILSELFLDWLEITLTGDLLQSLKTEEEILICYGLFCVKW